MKSSLPPSFSFHNLPPHPAILIVGDPGSGKSHLIKSILQTQNPSFCIIISPSEHDTPFYKLLFPTYHIIHKHDDAIIHDLIKRSYFYSHTTSPSPATIVFDDCLPHIPNSVKNLLSSNASLRITVICALSLKSQIHYITNLFTHTFIFRNDFLKNIKLFRDKYTTPTTFLHFLENYMPGTQHFNCLLIQKHTDHIMMYNNR